MWARPTWGKKNRRGLGSLWDARDALGTQSKVVVARLDDVKTTVEDNGHKISAKTADPVRHFDDQPYSVNGYAANMYATTIEIVKEGGMYSLYEDGLQQTPLKQGGNGISRSGYVAKNHQDSFRDPDPSSSAQDDLTRKFEVGRSGVNPKAIHYVIGDAKHRELDEKYEQHRLPCPLAIRVRIEEGQQPPTRCFASVRSVFVTEDSPVTRIQEVADYQISELGNVPMCNCADPTSGALIVPYPFSATTPPFTTLVSKKALRDTTDKFATKDERSGDSNSTTSWFSVLHQPFSKKLFNDLISKVKSDADRNIRSLIYKNRMRSIFNNVQWSYRHYGGANESVFKQLAMELEDVASVLKARNDGATTLWDTVWRFYTFVTGRQERDLVSEQLKNDPYSGMTKWQRELMEFITQVPNIEYTNKEVTGLTNSRIRPFDEYNSVIPDGMYRASQMQRRVDFYLDVELWDPEYNDVVHLCIAPGLEAAVDAGRVMYYHSYKEDFRRLVQASNELISTVKGLDETNVLPKVFPALDEPGSNVSNVIQRALGAIAYVNRQVAMTPKVRAENFEKQISMQLRYMLGLQNENNTNEKLLDDADWDDLPFFSPSYTRDKKGGNFSTIKDNVSFGSRHKLDTRLPKDTIRRRLIQLVSCKDTQYSLSLSDPSVPFTLDYSDRERMMETIVSARVISKALNENVKEFLYTELDATDGSEIGTPDYQTTQTFYKRTRLVFETFYDLKSPVNIDQNSFSEFSMLTKMPLPILPFSSRLPSEVTVRIGNVLSAHRFQNDVLLEAVGDSTNTQWLEWLVQAEAIEAFSAILVDVLNSMQTTDLTRENLRMSESLIAQKRTNAVSQFIDAIAESRNCALISLEDPLVLLFSESDALRIALPFSSHWVARSSTGAALLGRDAWTRQLKLFSKALRKVASMKSGDVLKMPLLNIQSSWLSRRAELPSDSVSLEANVVELARSYNRITLCAKTVVNAWDEQPQDVEKLLFAAVVDTLDSRPVVRNRVNPDRLDEILVRNNESIKEAEATITVKDISQEELRHSWACRRVFIPENIMEMPTNESSIEKLSNQLAACSVQLKSVYYVPVGCDSISNMRLPYDARMVMQRVVLANIKKLRLPRFKTTDYDTEEAQPTFTLKVQPINKFIDSETALHPFLMICKDDSLRFCVSMNHKLSVQDLAEFDEPPNTTSYEPFGSAVRNYTRTNTNAQEHLNNARQTLLFAVDRYYHAMLYSVYNNDDGARSGSSVNILIDLADAQSQEDTQVRDWPDSAPRVVVGVTDASRVFKFNMFAYLIASSMLPLSISSRLDVTFSTVNFEHSETIHGMLTQIALNLSSNGFSSIPLGELVACVTAVDL